MSDNDINSSQKIDLFIRTSPFAERTYKTCSDESNIVLWFNTELNCDHL